MSLTQSRARRPGRCRRGSRTGRRGGRGGPGGGGDEPEGCEGHAVGSSAAHACMRSSPTEQRAWNVSHANRSLAVSHRQRLAQLKACCFFSPHTCEARQGKSRWQQAGRPGDSSACGARRRRKRTTLTTSLWRSKPRPLTRSRMSSVDGGRGEAVAVWQWRSLQRRGPGLACSTHLPASRLVACDSSTGSYACPASRSCSSSRSTAATRALRKRTSCKWASRGTGGERRPAAAVTAAAAATPVPPQPCPLWLGAVRVLPHGLVQRSGHAGVLKGGWLAGRWGRATVALVCRRLAGCWTTRGGLWERRAMMAGGRANAQREHCVGHRIASPCKQPSHSSRLIILQPQRQSACSLIHTALRQALQAVSPSQLATRLAQRPSRSPPRPHVSVQHAQPLGRSPIGHWQLRIASMTATAARSPPLAAAGPPATPLAGASPDPRQQQPWRTQSSRGALAWIACRRPSAPGRRSRR